MVKSINGSCLRQAERIRYVLFTRWLDKLGINYGVIRVPSPGTLFATIVDNIEVLVLFCEQNIVVVNKLQGDNDIQHSVLCIVHARVCSGFEIQFIKQLNYDLIVYQNIFIRRIGFTL